MKTTIDGAGRVVIPKELREAAGLKPGSRLEVRLSGGCIEIEPEPVTFEVVRKRGKAFLVPEDSQAVLRTEDVLDAIAQSRERRG